MIVTDNEKCADEKKSASPTDAPAPALGWWWWWWWYSRSRSRGWTPVIRWFHYCAFVCRQVLSVLVIRLLITDDCLLVVGLDWIRFDSLCQGMEFNWLLSMSRFFLLATVLSSLDLFRYLYSRCSKCWALTIFNFTIVLVLSVIFIYPFSPPSIFCIVAHRGSVTVIHKIQKKWKKSHIVRYGRKRYTNSKLKMPLKPSFP